MDENGRDDGRDEIDRQFDELDELVEIAKAGTRDGPKAYLKYYTSVEMVNLIMEEIPPGDIRIYQQVGGEWIAEVKYKGVTFITNAGRHKSEVWKEF
ncbi:MAG: hypothetical protein Q8Q89_01905 [bacterium]|nr:hypothetical protein [bacterium]